MRRNRPGRGVPKDEPRDGWERRLGPHGASRAYAIGALGYIVLTPVAFLLPLSWTLWKSLVLVVLLVSVTVWRLAPPGPGTKLSHGLAALGIGLVTTPILMLLILFVAPVVCRGC